MLLQPFSFLNRSTIKQVLFAWVLILPTSANIHSHICACTTYSHRHQGDNSDIANIWTGQNILFHNKTKLGLRVYLKFFKYQSIAHIEINRDLLISISKGLLK